MMREKRSTTATLSAVLWLLLLTGLAPSSLAAQTLDELLASDELRARIVIDSDPPFFQRAPFVLSVEVATRRWFSRGTRVRDFRIPGAVVRPVSNFASNQTRREDGSSWSVQRWRFRVFAQHPGRLAIPPLQVFVSVSADGNVVVDGELTLRHNPVEIALPPGTAELEHWVAGSELEVEERWSGQQDSYRPGDAVTRVRRFVLEDAPAMMLESSDEADIEGLSLYRAPPSVLDQSNRGSLRGVREETLVVTFEQTGDYELPGLTLPWFNIRSGELERERIAATRFVVRGSAVDSAEQHAGKRTLPALNPTVIGLLFCTLLMALLLRRFWDTSPLNRTRQGVARKCRAAQQHFRFRRALGRRDSVACLQLLQGALGERGRYSRLQDAISSAQESEAQAAALSRSLRQLLEHAYGKGTDLPERAAALHLWRAIARPPKHRAEQRELSLNPRGTTE